MRHQVIRHVGAVARLIDGGASHRQQFAEAGAAIVESGAERPDADRDRRSDLPKVAAGRRRAAVHAWRVADRHGRRAAPHRRSRGRARRSPSRTIERRCAPVSAGASSDAARSTRMSVSRVMSSSVSTAVDGLMTWNAPLIAGELLVTLHQHADAGRAEEAHARAVDADPPVPLANRVGDDGVQVIGPVAVDPAGDLPGRGDRRSTVG